MPKKYVHIGYYSQTSDIKKYIKLDSAESVIRDCVHGIGAFSTSTDNHVLDETRYQSIGHKRYRFNDDKSYLSVWDIHENIHNAQEEWDSESYIDIYQLKEVEE